MKQLPGNNNFTPAQAYWNQRHTLKSLHERILALAEAVDRKTDLWPVQWAQIMAAALEFKPDLILELGRGKGNSTCAFTEVANQLRNEGANCNVVSLCISDDWENVTQWGVLQEVDEEWFRPLKALKGNILTFDYDSILKGVKRCLVLWDAHGYDVAECVLGRIMPKIAGIPNLVIMHDLSDARYEPPETSSYKGNRLWRGNNWSGPRIRLGYIDSTVEQAVAIVDFISRNKISFDSADHSFDIEIKRDAVKYKEMQEMLGNDLFSTGAHWFWFTLNEVMGTLTYPYFGAVVNNNFYEISIFERVQILDVSLRNAVIEQPHLKDIIPRINRYLKTEQTNLAVKMIETELGHLEESIEIFRKLREFVLKIQKDDAMHLYRLPESIQMPLTL